MKNSKKYDVLIIHDHAKYVDTLQVLFGDKLLAFYDLDVVANIINIVNQIGSQGLVGLVALWILWWIFTKK